jgi:AbrB family looped-hinge helix DNA binding protein
MKGSTEMARKHRRDEYSYSRTGMVRGREKHGRYAIIRQDRDQTRVVGRLADGTAPGPGELVPTADVFDVKATHVVPIGQRGTITLPGDIRRRLGLDEGNPVEIVEEADGCLSLRALYPTATEAAGLQLSDLLDRVTADNLHGEISTGSASGREAW